MARPRSNVSRKLAKARRDNIQPYAFPSLLAVSPEIKFIARGLVLAFAVWLDVRLSATE
jgi:hypothetical protein